MADKSAYIQLYDATSKHDDYKWQIKNDQAGVEIKDYKSARPMKFYADSFKFYGGGATPGPGYDLKTELDAADSAAASAQSKADANETAVAAESVRALAAEATVATNLSAEITARAAAIAVVQADVNQNESDGDAGRAVVAAAVVSEASARAVAVAAEATRAGLAEAGLQAQISSILANATAGSLDSLSEIVTAFQSADSTMAGTIGSHGTRLTAVEALLDQLLNQ